MAIPSSPTKIVTKAIEESSSVPALMTIVSPTLTWAVAGGLVIVVFTEAVFGTTATVKESLAMLPDSSVALAGISKGIGAAADVSGRK